MPRNISFAMTIEAVKNKTKTVTRRVTWKNVTVGLVLCGVEKAMGLRRGESIKRLGLIKVISLSQEPLNSITKEECVKEGFPDMEPAEFVDLICKAYKCAPDQIVNRIEFEYL